MNKKMFFISGLPRSGSTLLSTILNQNPLFFAGGNSPLCQIMWDTHISITHNAYEQISANRKTKAAENIIKSIPSIYYEDIENEIIFDKCRSWTIKENTEIIKKYIDNDFKIIVLFRNIEDIVKSFVNIDSSRDWESFIFNPASDPLMRSISGIFQSIENNKENCIFIDYDNLISDTKNQIDSIYKFIKIEPFDHDYHNIKQEVKEDDLVYGIKGLHDVRNKIEKRLLEKDIGSNSKKICSVINDEMYSKIYS